MDLDDIFADYGDGPLDDQYFDFNLQLIKESVEGASVLELSTNLRSTLALARIATTVTVVDGSGAKLDALAGLIRANDIKNVRLIRSDFFDFLSTNTEKFDEIILFRTLEHIEQRADLLSLIAKQMLGGSFLTVSVPNALSLHRRLGVQMGLLKDPYALTEADQRKGHVVNLDQILLNSALETAGLKILWLVGSFLKLVPDSELVSSGFYTDERLKAMFELSAGVDPDLCAELVARCHL